nr:hypothetical protein [Escherichia coli]
MLYKWLAKMLLSFYHKDYLHPSLKGQRSQSHQVKLLINCIEDRNLSAKTDFPFADRDTLKFQVRVVFFLPRLCC